MKVRHAILWLMLTLIVKKNCVAQVSCDTVFSKEYIATGNLQPFTVKNTTNGDFVVAGRASLTMTDDFQLMAARFSPTGSVRWSILLGGNNIDTIYGVCELSDGSLLLYGVARSFGFSEGKILFIRLRADGNLIWAKQIGLTGNSNNIIKDITQVADGDIIGTFNNNDSTSLSEPVVFKMGVDATIRWSRKFNNGAGDSFTSLSVDNDRVYVAGFSTLGNKKAVLVTLNAADGSLINSQSPHYWNTAYDQEIIDIEVFDSRISFGITAQQIIGNSVLEKLLLYHADLAGGDVSQRISPGFGSSRRGTKIMKRDNDNGLFMVHPNSDVPILMKLNRYLNQEWNIRQSSYPTYVYDKRTSIDITNTSGIISAAWYRHITFTNNQDRLVLTKTSRGGLNGPCTQQGGGYFSDTVFTQFSPITWNSETAVAITLNDQLTLSITPFLLTPSPFCDTALCIDSSSLPPACNKTSLVEYAGHLSSKIRDAVTVNDGGSIAVGELGNQGFIMRTGNNGDLLWSQTIDETGKQAIFTRVLKTDNNVYAFANNYYIIDHYSYRTVKVLKLNYDGSVLLSKEIYSPPGGGFFELGDVCKSPDGGFLAVFNWGWGSGYLWSFVIRFDSNLTILWQKEIKHQAATPVYRSITCEGSAVFIGHDTYDSYNQNKIGIQKLDYNTGNDLWSRGFTMNTNTLRLNKIFAINDTVYAFVNHYTQIDFYNYDFKIVMLKVSGAGDIIDAQQLNTDTLTWPSSLFALQNYDYSNPTVTFTADSNFVMSHAAKRNNTSVLNISKFDRFANNIWSRNYSQLNNIGVFNIKSHDSSIVIIGNILRPKSNKPSFKNSFLLKTNLQGNIVSTASGICLSEDRPFTSSPITVTEVPSRIDSVININALVLTDRNVTAEAAPYDATLYCNQVAYCSTVHIAGNPGACNLTDTIKLYTENNNCDAVVRFTYDTSYLILHSYVNDTVRFLPRQAGVSTVFASIETPCMDSIQQIQVAVLLNPQSLNIGADTSLCAGTAINVNAGSGYNQYLWQDGSIDSVYNITQPGIYWVQVSDYCGNIYRDSISVTPYSEDLNLGSDRTKCNADTLQLVAPVGFINYEWANNYNISSLSGQQVVVYPTVDTTYYLRAEKIPGCYAYDTVRIYVNTSAPVDLGPDIRFCSGDSIVLNAGNGFAQYEWSTGAIVATLTVRNSGTYSVAATAGNGCTSRDTIVIAAPYTLPVVNLGADAPLCAGGNRSFDAGTGFSQYNWNTGSTASFITTNTPGIYAVTVTDVNGCKGKDTAVITQIVPLPTGFMPPDTSICNYGNLLLKPLNNYQQYTWSTGNSQATLSINQPGTYWLQVKDINNCIGRDTIVVALKECLKGLFVPSAFTPNNDGRNDLLVPNIFGNVVSYRFTIYNRWGQIVFQSSKTGEGWNGKVKGVATDGNVFVWQCIYQLQGEQAQHAKGTVTLIK